MTSQLTKHLYRVDEVKAALQWCIMRGRCIDTVFWATELNESGHVVDLQETLQLSWLYGIGCKGLAWLSRICDFKEPVLTAIGLARAASIRDSSVVAILGLGLREERVGPTLLPKATATWTVQEQFLYRASSQGKVGPLWDWLASSAEIPWSTVERIGTLKFGTSRFPEIRERLEGRTMLLRPAEKKALLCAILAQPVESFAASMAVVIPTEYPREVADALADWAQLEGRHRRVLTIPFECLHGTTERGGLERQQSTDVEIRSLRALETVLARSPYWKKALEASRQSDDAREEFYDTEFPHDIPDEWSGTSRAVSHGCGPVPAGATSWTLGRWLQTWFGRIPSFLVWEGVQSMAERVDAEFDWDPHSSAWEAIRDGALSETGSISWNFAPARVKITPKQATS